MGSTIASGARSRGCDEAGRHPPGFDPETRRPCTCRKRPFLIFFTTFTNSESPVRCGACFGPIPMYKLPATSDSGSHQDVLLWRDTYQALIGSSSEPVQESGSRTIRFARHDSPLSKDGRELARTLEKRFACRSTTIFQGTSAEVTRQSASASARPVARPGSAASLCIKSSTSNVVAAGCCRTWPLT